MEDSIYPMLWINTSICFLLTKRKESGKCFSFLMFRQMEVKPAVSLNVQGQLIIEIFDNKTILAPVALKDGDIILDSGTGSGINILSILLTPKRLSLLVI